MNPKITTLINKYHKAAGATPITGTGALEALRVFHPEIVTHGQYGRRIKSLISARAGNSAFVTHIIPSPATGWAKVVMTSYQEVIAWGQVCPAGTMFFSVDFKKWAYIVQNCYGADVPSQTTERRAQAAVEIFNQIAVALTGRTNTKSITHEVSPTTIYDTLPYPWYGATATLAPSHNWEVRKSKYPRYLKV